MSVIVTIFYFIITIGILVLVHELGHFLAAKFFKMRVDTFSIGFPPRAFGRKIGETDYCISWIPIGGYVKIAGMIDESFDTEFLSHEPQPWEFRSKPIWQRMVVMAAGVIMNVLLAILIFWGINYLNVKVIYDTTEVGIVLEHSSAAQAGFRQNDKIISVNGRQIENWDDLQSAIYIENPGSDLTFTILRSEHQQMILVPHKSIPDFNEDLFGLLPAGTPGVVSVNSVEKKRPAEQLGLKSKDIIVSLNDTKIAAAQQVLKIVRANIGKEVSIRWMRNDTLFNGKVIPDPDGRIGIVTEQKPYIGPKKEYQYTILEAFPRGVSEIWNVTVLIGKSIWHVIIGKTPFQKSFGGPIRIAQFATQSAEYGIGSFLGFLALLSVSLAFLNILPFPALDGGHIVFLLYEGIFRKEISTKVKLAFQQVGFFLLLAFMAFVIYNDIANF
jgi:regulator of sigma E protease